MAPPATVAQVFRTCANCGRSDILAANIMLHEAHCSRFFRRCPHCEVLVETKGLEEHIREARGTPSSLAAALEADDPARVRSALDHGIASCTGSATDGTVLSALIDERGTTLLHLACARDRWDFHALVAEMLRLGANVHARDQLGRTALHTAARTGAAASITLLLAANADIDARDPLGSTPLEMASGEEAKAVLVAAGGTLPGSRGSSRSSSRASDSMGSRRASTENLVALASTPSAAALSGAFERATRLDGDGLVPRPPPSDRPPSSRHAQRLRSMVHVRAPPQPS